MRPDTIALAALVLKLIDAVSGKPQGTDTAYIQAAYSLCSAWASEIANLDADRPGGRLVGS
jgi:hypothetical protein